MSIKLMNAVWESDSTSGSDRLVLLALADSANDDGYCWPSYETIARKANLGRRYVIVIMEKLESAGLVKKTHRFKDGDYTSNLYQVVNNSTPRVVNHDSPASEQESTTLVNHDSLKPSFNHNEPSTRASPDGENRDVDNRTRRTDARVKGDIFDGMLAYADKGDPFSWCPEYIRPLAQTFSDSTGMIPLKAEHGRWIKAFTEQYDMGIRPDQVSRAIKKMQKDGLTIGGPESITKTARSIKAVKQEVFAEEYR